MTHRERFAAIFQFQPVDRIPLYYFGTWPETKHRWVQEGLKGTIDFEADAGPQVPGMDPDWEYDMWGCHGLVNQGLWAPGKPEVIEETDTALIVRTPIGEILKTSKLGSSIPETIQYALEPARESWERFKCFLNAEEPQRRPDDWQEKAKKVAQKDQVLGFFGGSLYGLLRNWMGVENISCLMYDDPDLLLEMTNYLSDFYMACMGPVLDLVPFDMAYLFEDCCGATGPLFSPAFFQEFYMPIYKKLISFYKDCGVKFVLLDSDGKSDLLIPLWAQCGVDIMFPLEVGTWKGNAAHLRQQYGQKLCFMGGIDKSVISKGKDAVRKHLLEIKPEVDKGGYLPIPDHRIPPECSYQTFLDYVEVFHDVFG